MPQQLPVSQLPVVFSHIRDEDGAKVEYRYSAFGTLVSKGKVQTRVKKVETMDEEPSIIKLPKSNTYFVQTHPLTKKYGKRWQLVKAVIDETTESVHTVKTVVLACGHTIMNTIFFYKVEGHKGVHPLNPTVGDMLICCPTCT